MRCQVEKLNQQPLQQHTAVYSHSDLSLSSTSSYTGKQRTRTIATAIAFMFDNTGGPVFKS